MYIIIDYVRSYVHGQIFLVLSDTNYRHRTYLIVRLTMIKNINDENIVIHLVGLRDTFSLLLL